MYYIWESDATLYDKFLYASKTPEKLFTGDWVEGKPGVQQRGPLKLEGDRKCPAKLSDMVLTQFELPILSPRAMTVLKEAGVDNLEAYPIQIKHPKMKSPEKSYQIINVVGLVACVDKDHAAIKTYTSDPSRIFTLRQYQLLENKIPKNLKVFRLEEFSGHLLVDPSVKDAWEKAGLTGAKFTPTEKYV